MTAWLAGACVIFGIADLVILGLAVTRRSVLPVLCALGGLALLSLAVASGLAGASAKAVLLISVITTAIGAVLLWLSQAVWRLLDDVPEPEEGS